MAVARTQFDPASYFNDVERQRLRHGAAVVTLPDASQNEIAMVGAVRTEISIDRFVKWNRHQDRIYSGAFAPAGGRFSNPPRLEDLNQLTLRGEDLQALRNCEPGDCGLKLAAGEMAAIRAAMDSAGPNWRPAGLDAFRRVLVARATAFLKNGMRGVAPYEDHRRVVSPAAELAEILGRPERAAAAGIDGYLRAFPDGDRSDVESLLFWSKNVASGAREVVSITHVTIARDPAGQFAVVAGAQVYATHYLDASLSYTVLSGAPPNRYLSYLRRVRLDVLRGTFGGIVRHMVSRRVRAEAPGLLVDLRRKLESGDPPVQPAAPSSR